MILAELTIRDYKQFAGEHAFEPDRQGITAVIGPNGAGKTTLFEAIEWCLYGPRSISNTDVLPRGVGGSPLVRITLEEPRTGQRFVVERRLTRGKTMQADVWDESNPGEMLATGSAPVKKFVSEQLIGLGHAAFISTFFTRQKELSFFGSVGDTKRRRMVGQMIGIEAVRLAQEAIGEERTRAAANADALGTIATQDMGERDLPAEIAAAEAELASAREFAARRSAEAATARAALTTANEESERVRLRAEQDQALAREIAGLEAERGRIETRIEGLDVDLVRLQEAATRRADLLPIAATVESLRRDVENWEREKQKELTIAERTRSLAGIADDRTNAVGIVRRLVDGSATAHAPEWMWQNEADLDSELSRLLSVSSTFDIDADRQRLSRYESITSKRTELKRSSDDLDRYRSALGKLRSQEEQLLATGDPSTEIARLQSAINDERQMAARHESEQQQATAQARQLAPLVENLRKRTFDDHCPTCGRSISESEAADVIATLDQQIASWQGIAAQRRDDGQRVRVRVSELEVEFTTAQQRANTLIELRTRISNGEEKTAEKEAEVARLTADLDALQGDAVAPATDAEIADLRERVKALSAISVAAQGVAQRYAQLQELAKREIGERAMLAELGESAYDVGKHRAASESLDEANRAAATIQTIDRDLGRRDDIVARREASAGEIATIGRDLDRVAKDRVTLAYQDDESRSARERASAAADADRQATSLLHMAQTAERERSADVGRLQEEQRRWQQQLDRSAALRREADELSEMYKEFALFDQFVAARVAPRLAEQTSELLELATDGKYTSVEFDENYGIHVFDGVTEKFPIESFSGGERDVVALCARLALSQLIGSSAAHPPSFLVLDEVFGALDRDRRMQLLELLGRISESIEAFQQMFIISHVDDVRTSPIFSRVIRIVESANGSSRIEDATASASFEE